MIFCVVSTLYLLVLRHQTSLLFVHVNTKRGRIQDIPRSSTPFLNETCHLKHVDAFSSTLDLINIVLRLSLND